MNKILLTFLFTMYGAFTASVYAGSSDGQPSTDYDIDKHLEQVLDVGCMGIENAEEAMSLVKGVCIWLKIKLFSVEVKTSLVVQHRVPDLLVQASTGQQDSPIPVMKQFDSMNESIGSTLFSYLSVGGGATTSEGMHGGSRSGNSKTEKQGGNHSNNINFYDVQIIGNPYLPVYEELMSSIMESTEIGSYCESEVTPFQPYYNSLSDMEWRFGLYERLKSLYDSGGGLKSGTRNINNGTELTLDNITSMYNDLSLDGLSLDDISMDDVSSAQKSAGIHWGYIYPRMGFTQQQSQYRSAALTAFRAVDLATNDSGLHTNNGQWPPNDGATDMDFGITPVSENNPESHKFQMNYPQMSSKSSCYNFPDKEFDKNIMVTDITPTEGALLNQKNTYIWTLWRQYKCCNRKGQIFVGKIEY